MSHFFLFLTLFFTSFFRCFVRNSRALISLRIANSGSLKGLGFSTTVSEGSSGGTPIEGCGGSGSCSAAGACSGSLRARRDLQKINAAARIMSPTSMLAVGSTFFQIGVVPIKAGEAIANPVLPDPAAEVLTEVLAECDVLTACVVAAVVLWVPNADAKPATAELTAVLVAALSPVLADVELWPELLAPLDPLLPLLPLLPLPLLPPPEFPFDCAVTIVESVVVISTVFPVLFA